MGELKRLQCLDQQLHALNIEINQKLDKDHAGFSTCNSRLVAAVHACINIMVCSLLYACPMCTYIYTAQSMQFIDTCAQEGSELQHSGVPIEFQGISNLKQLYIL